MTDTFQTRGSQCVLIPLSNGGHAIVDADAPRGVFQIKWCMVSKKNGLRYAHGRYPIKYGGRGRMVLLHHLVMGKPTRGEVLDHINGDGLDNRIANLQLITQSRNLMKGRRALAGGATYDKHERKWRARHRIDLRLVDLGFFATKEEALAAVRKSREQAWKTSLYICPEFSP